MKRKFIGYLVIAALAVCAFSSGQAMAADAHQQFNDEDIKPYIKIIKGPWVNNTVTGGSGSYRLDAKVSKEAEYVVGLFDHKINRRGEDARCAVVLVDGVNPLAPGEAVAVHDIDNSDVSWMRKVPFDGLTFNSRDTAGKDCCLKVVDAKEEFEFGPVKPLKIPAGRSGNLGRVDVIIYKGPANPPTPGQAVNYGKPLNKFVITLSE